MICVYEGIKKTGGLDHLHGCCISKSLAGETFYGINLSQKSNTSKKFCSSEQKISH